MASKMFDIGAAFGFLPSTEKSFRLLTAIAGSLPERMRGRDSPSAIARKADLSAADVPAAYLSGGRWCRARFSQQSVTFMPGVRDSMESCASRWELVGSGD